MVEPGELNPVSDSSLKFGCKEGCHFSCVPLKEFQFGLVCWVFSLFIWLVLVALFCFFPILHGKVQVAFGNFLYLHKGNNSVHVAINPKLRNCQAAPLQPWLYSQCVQWVQCFQKAWVLFCERGETPYWYRGSDTCCRTCVVWWICTVPGERPRTPVQAAEKTPPSHWNGRIGLLMSLLCKDPQFSEVEACVFGGYKRPQGGKHSKIK